MSQKPLFLRLRKMHALGTGPGRYRTLDGRFEISQGGNGAGSWTICAFTEADGQRLTVAELDRGFLTLSRAREFLAGSIYEEPHGWLHQNDESVAEAYSELMRARFES